MDNVKKEKEFVMPKYPNWYGWENGSKIDFFNDNEIACKCEVDCEKCGFNFLSADGSFISREKKPLCGEW